MDRKAMDSKDSMDRKAMDSKTVKVSRIRDEDIDNKGRRHQAQCYLNDEEAEAPLPWGRRG